MRRKLLMQLMVGLTLFWLAASPSLAGELHFESSAEPVQLIELYTSEGCSSCPPADRWLSALERDPGLWEQFVPIAFHVTYWNYLGWSDRFGRAEFDARHRWVASNASAVVYTPGLFVGGREWRAWRRGARPPQYRDVSLGGLLNVSVVNEQAHVFFDPNTQATNPTAHLVWLHTAETEVKHGENKGRRLRHDFIAGQVRSVDLASSSADDTWQGTIRIDPEERDNSRAIAVWITTADGSVLQASGSWTHQVSGD